MAPCDYYEPRLPDGRGFIPAVIAAVVICMVLFSGRGCARAEVVDKGQIWKITAYCACVQCCGKTDAITASGQQARYGMVACNWLKFGTRVHIDGLGWFVVADRGAKSLFGSKKNHIKHLDVYMPTHNQARRFGVQYRRVTQ
jgi:3D (Asp-Asp-Asp) domain-containing protein